MHFTLFSEYVCCLRFRLLSWPQRWETPCSLSSPKRRWRQCGALPLSLASKERGLFGFLRYFRRFSAGFFAHSDELITDRTTNSPPTSEFGRCCENCLVRGQLFLRLDSFPQRPSNRPHVRYYSPQIVFHIHQALQESSPGFSEFEWVELSELMENWKITWNGSNSHSER